MKFLRGYICRRFVRLHREEDAQLLVIGAIFTMVIVILLTVTVNLAHVTHQKIKAQNAADAAAMAAGIWQVRALSFVQSLNNTVVYVDGVSYAGLILAAILGKSAHGDPTGASIFFGNIALGVATGGHMISQFVLLPFRFLYAKLLAPTVVYVSASELARANGASPALAGLPAFIAGVTFDTPARMFDETLMEMGMNPAMPEDSNVLDALSGGIDAIGGAAESILAAVPVYAINTDILNGELIDIGLVNGEAKQEHLPLFHEDVWVMSMVKQCYLLHPVYLFSDGYFKMVERLAGSAGRAEQAAGPDLAAALDEIPAPRGLWRHDFLESSEDSLWSPDGGNGEDKLVRLGPSTWATAVRASSEPGNRSFEGWTRAWDAMGGLGVRRNVGGDRPYGELGAMALSSVRVFARPVTWFDPRSYQGWVELVPVRSLNVFGEGMDAGVAH